MLYFCAKFETVMYDYLTKLHKKVLFSLDDVVDITHDKRRASSLLGNYQKKGLVSKIRRNLYCVNNLATKLPEASKYQIASHLSPTATVVGHAAMEYYGFAHQTFYELTVASATRFTSFEFDGIQYIWIGSKNPNGVVSPIGDSLTRVTSLERTIVDCIDKIELCGGVEELFNCISAIKFVDDQQLLQNLKFYDKIALYKKTGFVLSLQDNQLHLPKDFFDFCCEKSIHSTTRLTTLEPCPKYVSKWRLYIPDYINVTNYDNF
jgi:predicted transcriptional regulator of viral defense system